MKKTYFLAELDEIIISGLIAENRLKTFHSQYLLTLNLEIESLLNQPMDSKSLNLNTPIEIAVYPYSSLQPNVLLDLLSKEESSLSLSSVPSSSDKEME